MRKKQVLPLLGLGIIFSLAKPHHIYANPTFGGGSGTEVDPYQLSTPEHLNQLREAVDGGNSFVGNYFILTDDIDFTDYDNDSDPSNGNFVSIGRGWARIPQNLAKAMISFSGNLDGNQHTISNLRILLPGETNVGLFANLEHAEISNLHLKQVEIQGEAVVGGIAAGMNSTTIKNSSVSGTVLGEWGVGGLVGITQNSTITQSFSTTNVIGRDYVGGIVAASFNLSLNESFSQGQVNGNQTVAGLVGEAYQPTNITNCYSLSQVTGDSSVGGLVGEINNLESSNELVVIKNSYYEGAVNGTQSVGKLIGQLGLYDDYDDVWYDGSVSIDNVYLNQEKNTNYQTIGDITHGTVIKEGVMELTTAQMMQENAKNHMTTLDFNNIWTTTSTTPMFRWQKDLTSATKGDIQINGTIEAMIANVTIPSVLPDLVIDPNSLDGAISPEFSIENQSTSPIKLDLRTFEQTTNTFNDVLPDKYDSWEGLNKTQSQDIALGLLAKEGDGWQRLTTPISYVANHMEHEIGVIKPTSQVNFEFEVHHGRAFSESKSIQYRMVFVFDLLS